MQIANYVDVYEIEDTRLNHVQRASAIPIGASMPI